MKKEKSTYRQTKIGLPKGAVSNTTLFNIFINNLPSRIKPVEDLLLLYLEGTQHLQDYTQHSTYFIRKEINVMWI